MSDELQTAKEVQNEFTHMFQNLEEAIVMVKNQDVIFTNTLFQEIFDKMVKPDNIEDLSMLDIKMLKVYRKTESDDSDRKPNQRNQEANVNQIFTLREILGKTQKFLNDKIFQLNLNYDSTI